MRRLFIGTALGILVLGAGFALYRQGFIRLNYPSSSRFPVRGIDVSHHQGAIDWRSVKSAGVDFAFIKASEGREHRDREFGRNWEEAGRAGIARGAYHFFAFCTSGLEQASNFVASMGRSVGELAPVVDVEFSGNCANPPSGTDLRKELRTFLDEVECASGRRPMLYFTREASKRVLQSEFDDHLRWPRDVLWEPHGTTWHFWQFADNGRIPGIRTQVDLDVFSGSKLEFDELLRSTAALPKPRPEPAGFVGRCVPARASH